MKRNNLTLEDKFDIISSYKMILSGKIGRFDKNTWVPLEYGLKNAEKVTRYLIESVLQWTKDDAVNLMSHKIFRKYKLGGMLSCVFDSCPMRALENAYPGLYDVKTMKLIYKRVNPLESEITRFKRMFKNCTHDEILELYSKRDFAMTRRFYHIFKNVKISKFEFLDMMYQMNLKLGN